MSKFPFLLIWALVITVAGACSLLEPRQRLPAAVDLPKIQESIGATRAIKAQCRPCANRASYLVHLTFDDGPSFYTETVLNTLREKNVKATFFQLGAAFSLKPSDRNRSHLRGEFVDEAQRLAQLVQQDGHGLASHGLWHIDHVTQKVWGKYELGFVKQNLEKSFSTLPPTTLRMLRLPYGQGWWNYPAGSEESARQKAIMSFIESSGWKHLWWDIDTFDWNPRYQERQPELMLADICEQKGGIVLMHDIHPWMAKNLGALIESIRCSGHKVVGFDEIEAENARVPKISFRSSATPVFVDCEAGLGEIQNGRCIVKPGAK